MTPADASTRPSSRARACPGRARVPSPSRRRDHRFERTRGKVERACLRLRIDVTIEASARMARWSARAFTFATTRPSSRARACRGRACVPSPSRRHDHRVERAHAEVERACPRSRIDVTIESSARTLPFERGRPSRRARAPALLGIWPRNRLSTHASRPSRCLRARRLLCACGDDTFS